MKNLIGTSVEQSFRSDSVTLSDTSQHFHTPQTLAVRHGWNKQNPLTHRDHQLVSLLSPPQQAELWDLNTGTTSRVCSLSVQSSFAEFIVHNNLIWYWCSSSVHPQSDRSSFSFVETSHLGFILKYFVFRRRRRCLVHTFLYTNCMLQLCLNSIYNDASVGECRYFSKEESPQSNVQSTPVGNQAVGT